MLNVTNQYGFVKFADLQIQDGAIPAIAGENKKNVIYAITVDNDIVYIGKTKNLKKRIGYYRTAIHRSTPTSDTVKSSKIHDALASGKTVSFYARQCFNLSMTNELGTMSISTMDLEEPHFIKLFNPPWNVQHRSKTNGLR